MASRLKADFVIEENLSPNKNSPRTGKIRRLTPHCTATLNAKGLSIISGRMLSEQSGISCNYGIGFDGSLACGVYETDRAWTTSNRDNDMEAITFEISNVGKEPDWKISDESVTAWVRLAVDICKFYGFKSVMYKDKPSSIGKSEVEKWLKTWDAPEDCMIITLHRWYASKACPGDYFVSLLPALVDEINLLLGYEGPEPIFDIPLDVPENEVERTSFVRLTTKALNMRNGPSKSAPSVGMLTCVDSPPMLITERRVDSSGKEWGKLDLGPEQWILLTGFIEEE